MSGCDGVAPSEPPFDGPLGLIVADDLTGAADACAKFVVAGLTGAVRFDRGASVEPRPLDVDVLAVSTDTRQASPALARRRIEDVAARYSCPPAIVFKKIDSTLRGPIGAEVDAARRAFGCTHVLLTPAFPAMGRVVRDGWLVAAGLDGDTRREVAAVLAGQGVDETARGACVAVPVSIAEASNNIDALRRAIAAVPGDATVVFVFDADSDGHLDEVVAAGLAMGGPPLWSGSAGLAAALARRLSADVPGRHAPDVSVRASTPDPRGPVVLFVGSQHPVTAAQLDALCQEHGALSHPVSMLSPLLIAGSSGHPIIATLDAGEDVSPAVRAIVEGFRTTPPAGLVLSGGDTASAVCAALGSSALRICGEVEEGVPWGILDGGLGHSLPVVLKSGGFGTAHTFTHVVEFLSRRRIAHV